MKICKFLFVGILSMIVFSASAQDPVKDKSIWAPFGNSLNAMVTDSVHNQLIMGGKFNYVGPQNGYMASINLDNYEADIIINSPNGTVYDAVEDGEGGWFIGGLFSMVGDEERQNLAHILADGTVDPWAPQVDGRIKTMVLIDSELFIGGSFDRINGLLKDNVAAIDRFSGDLLDWKAETTGDVNVLTERNDTIYAGGSFISANHYGKGIAQINAETGVLDIPFPSVNFKVTKVLSDQRGGWFIAGDFYRVDDESRWGIAHINSNGKISDWYPDLPQFRYNIKDMELNDGELYVVGNFTVSNDSIYRLSGLSLDTATAEITNWNPRYFGYVNDIEIVNDTVYAGGSFKSAGDWSANASQTDTISGKNYGLNNNFNASVTNSISDENDGWYVAGEFTELNNRPTMYLAHIDSLGPVSGFSCEAQGVNALALHNDVLYLGGAFTTVNNQPAEYLAAVNAETGALLPIDFGCNGEVKTIKIVDDILYVGGLFGLLGGKARGRIGAINLLNNQVLNWEIGFTDEVTEFDILDNKIFIAGRFIGTAAGTYGTIVNSNSDELEYDGLLADAPITASCPDGNDGWYIAGTFQALKNLTRPGIGQINADGSIASWSHSVDGEVLEMKLYGDTLILVGEFTTVNGAERNNFAAFSISNNTLLPWAPSFDEPVTTIEKLENRLFVGGEFHEIDNIDREHFAEFDFANGTLQSWDPYFEHWVLDMQIYSNILYLAGYFHSINGEQRKALAAFHLGPDTLTDWAPLCNSYVHQMDIRNNELYVAGNFTQIDNQNVQYIAGFNLNTGLRITTPGLIAELHIGKMKINADKLYFTSTLNHQDYSIYSFITNTQTAHTHLSDGIIKTLSFNSSSVFFGGTFSGISAPRERLAALNRTTGALIDWHPSANHAVNNLVAEDDKVYINGLFTDISETARLNFATLSASTGSVLDFTVLIPTGGFVNDMEIYSGNLYLVGNGLSFNGPANTHSSVAYRLSDNSLLPWHFSAKGTAETISIKGSKIFVGGSFTSNYYSQGVGDMKFSHIAASNDTDGSILDWSCTIVGTEVHSLASDGERLFLGGNFGAVNSETRQNLASIDLSTQTLLDWNPNAESIVRSIELSGDSLYLTGNFDGLNEISRNSVGALNATTGETLDWYFELNGVATALYINNNTVYLAGPANPAVNATRSIWALDRVTAEVLDWNLNYSTSIYDIDTYENQVFVGGNFSNLNGTPRINLAAFSRSNGDLLDWDPVFNTVYCMEQSDYGLFVGGESETDISEPIALLNYADGSEIPTGLEIEYNYPIVSPPNIRDISIHENRLYFGGKFNEVNGEDRINVAALNFPELTLNEWNIDFQKPPSTFAFSGDTIWIGADYYIGEVFRPLKSFLTTGEELTVHIHYFPWSISKLTIDSNRLFAFGNFESMGGVERENIAAIDLATGKPNDFAIPDNPKVRSLAIHNSNLFIGTDAENDNPEPLLSWNLNTSAFNSSWQPSLYIDGTNSNNYAGAFITSIYGFENELFATTNDSGVPYLRINATTGEALETNFSIPTYSNFEGDSNLLIPTGFYYQPNQFKVFDLETQLPMPWDIDFFGGINAIQYVGDDIYLAGRNQVAGEDPTPALFKINRENGAVEYLDPFVSFIPQHIFRSQEKLFIAAQYLDNINSDPIGGVRYIDLTTNTLSNLIIPRSMKEFEESNGLLAISFPGSGYNHKLSEYYQLSLCQTNGNCSDTTIYLNDEGVVSLLPEDIDNGSTSTCEISSITLGTEDFNCDYLGINNIGLTVNTADGYGASCNALITVIDTIYPVISVSDYNIQIPDSGVFHLDTQNLYGIATDNCSIDTIHILSGNTSYTCADQGNSFPIEVMVVDLSGNSTTGTVNMTIIASPICCATQATVLTSDTTICQGETIDISIELSGLPPFELNFAYNGISFPPVITADANYTLTVSPSVTTTYTFTSVTDQNCQGLVYNPELTINVLPVTNAGIDADTLFCASGDDLNLFTVFAANINVPGQFSPSSGLSQLAINSGTYYFIVNNDVCGFDTATFNVQIADTISIENVLVSCEDDPYFYQVSFDIEGGISPFQVNAEQWNDAFYESEFFSVLDSPSIEFTVSDGSGCPAQTITAQIEDSDDDGVCDAGEIVGCMLPTASNYNPLATDPSWCSFSPMAYPSFPDLEPTGGKGLGNYDTSMPVEKRTDFLDFQIAPNPSTTGTGLEAFINSGAKHELSIITIYSITGVKILEQSIEIEKGYNQIWIQNSMTVAAGIYLAAIKCGNERITRKFVITR